MRKIAIRTKKGGVGKTTLSANIAHWFAKNKKRVCVVDCDSQYNLTTMLGIEEEKVNGNILSYMEGASLEDIVLEVRPNLFLLPSNKKINERHSLFNTRLPELILKNKLDKIHAWDVILFDCPPSSSILIDNVLCAVNEIWVPMQMEFLSFEGVEQIILEIAELNESFQSFGVKTKIKAIIPTMIDSRVKLTGEVREAAKKRYGSFVLEGIKRNIRIAEAPAFGQTIFEYDPESSGAKDYELLAKKLIQEEI